MWSAGPSGSAGAPRWPACGGRRPRGPPGGRSRDRSGSTVRSVACCFSGSMPSSAPVCSAITVSAESSRSRAWSSRPSSESGDILGALSTLEASWRSTAWTMRSFALVSTRSPMISATVASTSAARSATSSDWTRSSTSAAAAVAVERGLGAERLLDLRRLLGDAHAAFLDLIAALAVRETPVIEDLAAFAQVLVALGDDRLRGPRRRRDVLSPLPSPPRASGARTSAPRRPGWPRTGWRRRGSGSPAAPGGVLRTPSRVEHRDSSDRGQNHGDDDQDDCDDHEWRRASGKWSGADRQVEWVACLGDEPLGEEVGGGRQGASPIPAEGHGTRDRRVAKRDHRHPVARHRQWHGHQGGSQAGLDQPLDDREVVALVGDVGGQPLGREGRIDDPPEPASGSGRMSGSPATSSRRAGAPADEAVVDRDHHGYPLAKSGWISRSTTPVGGGPRMPRS